MVIPGLSLAHNVESADRLLLESTQGIQSVPYLYLGAKHMVTGYDHLLYLAGVIFFLFRLKEVALFVSLFALGHSLTLLSGVMAGWQINPYIVDGIIGLSVSYKAFENLGGFNKFFGIWLDMRISVLAFGLVHGLGLSTKLQELRLDSDGLILNLVAFNVGVELGQLFALTFLLLVFTLLRRSTDFERDAIYVNMSLMTAGFILFGYQMIGYVLA